MSFGSRNTEWRYFWIIEETAISITNNSFFCLLGDALELYIKSKTLASIKSGFEMGGVGLTSQVDGLSNGTVQNGILLVGILFHDGNLDDLSEIDKNRTT